jgi:hypothetical protein
VKRLAVALLLASSPAAAHDARASESFTFTTTEKVAEGRDAAQASNARDAQVTSFATSLEYGDGHRESVAGTCSARVNPPGAAFSQTGVCVAPGAYTLEFHCQATPEKTRSNCWGQLTGALEGHHNGLTGLVTYQVTPEGAAGVGRWNN